MKNIINSWGRVLATHRDRFFGSADNHQFYTSPGGPAKGIYGGVVASLAGVLVLPGDALMYTISGALAITGIQVPYTGFQGIIILIPSGTFTWTTATNIGLAGTAVVGKIIIMAYDGTKWWPSVIA